MVPFGFICSYKVVAVVAGSFNSVTLNNLMPNTQYKVSVTAIKSGKKYRSKRITFRTLESGIAVTEAVANKNTKTSVGNVITVEMPPVVKVGDGSSGGSVSSDSSTSLLQPQPSSSNKTFDTTQNYTQDCGRKKTAGQTFTDIQRNVRGIEVTIVVLVLMVWVGAIILFFNRWGKIRMLIPYQPDYKETQLKVPGTGACSSSSTHHNQTGSTLCCAQRNVITTTYQCLRTAPSTLPPLATSCLNEDHNKWECARLSGGRARCHSQSVSYQYMPLGLQMSHCDQLTRKTRSAEYIALMDYNRWGCCGDQNRMCEEHGRRRRRRVFEKIPTVSISIASEDSDTVEPCHGGEAVTTAAASDSSASS